MAKQAGVIKYKGTLDELVGYQRGDDYFFRTKGHYKTRKQMEQQPERYGRVLEQSSRFKRAANLAGWVWHLYMPKAHRKNGDFGRFTGRANRLVQAGLNDWQILVELVDYCRTLDPGWVAGKPPLEKTNARQWAQGYTEGVPPAVAVESTATEAEAAVAEVVRQAIPIINEQLKQGLREEQSKPQSAPTHPDKPTVTVRPKPTNKPMRILSRWKVNRRGRLLVPKQARIVAAASSTVMDNGCVPDG